MNLTRFDEKIAAELSTLPGMGITTVKTFTAYNNQLRLPDGDIFRALRIARDHGMLVLLHAENGDVIETLISEALAAHHLTPEWHAKTRPAWGAVEATLRASSLAAQAESALYIVHMNVAGEVDMLRYARQHGVRVMGETCPQYLFFTEDDLRRPDGAKWVCSPPVRTKADNARLWEGLADGTLQTIGTDHCAFFFDGTSVQLPPSPALRQCYPPGSNQHGESHWPMLRMLVAHDLQTGLAMRPQWGPANGKRAVGEQQLLEASIDRLPASSLVVGDANFGVFSVAYCGTQRGHSVLLRLTAVRALHLAGGPLQDGMDRSIAWKPTREDRRRHPHLPKDACVH